MPLYGGVHKLHRGGEVGIASMLCLCSGCKIMKRAHFPEWGMRPFRKI